MVFQFKIKIEGLSEPAVWREVQVPAKLSFYDFHIVIQHIFGWENSHLWNFEPLCKSRKRRPAFIIVEPYDKIDYLDGTETLIASETTLDKIFPSTRELVYTYDYGDNWKHSIKLVGFIDEYRESPVCVKGAGSTPPEDCGGILGYEDLKNAFASGNKEKTDFYRDWLYLEDDEVWDPNFFPISELEDINKSLEYIKVPIPTGKTMAYINSSDFVSEHVSDPAYYTVQELLKLKTVPELRSLALVLGFRFKSGVKKDVMLDLIAERMLNRPETLISSAFYFELKAFLDIVDGKMSHKYAEDSGLLFEFNRFGLIYALEYGKNKPSTIHFQMDVADRIASLIPDELKRRERDGSLLFEKMAFGFSNIYGYTEMYYLQEYFKEIGQRVGCTFDDASLTKAFYPILCELDNGAKEEKNLFLSPFAKSANFYPDEDHIRFEIEAKKYDLDTVLKYGEMPYPQFPGKEADALRKVIQKYGKAGITPDEILRKLWRQHQEFNLAMPDLDFLAIPSESALQPCLNAIMDFQNNVPCWKLGGNTSSDIWKAEMATTKGTMPHIVPGPNLRAMGAPFPAEPFTSLAKVGRNDPCPCGSGKKYKQCCGRNK